MNIRNQNNKIIVPKQLKLKNIQKVIDKAITPKCQLKWEISYEKIFNWYILNTIKCIQSIIQFQWKCLHKNEIESLMHLFYRCHKIKHVLDELKHMFNIIFENNIVLVEENVIIVVYEGEITADLRLVNLIICILKWGA